jgi:hypothetical protein
MKRMAKAAAAVALTVGIAGMIAAPAHAAETDGTYSDAVGGVSIDKDILSILPILEGITQSNNNGMTLRNSTSQICPLINILSSVSCGQTADQANTGTMDTAAPGDVTIDAANTAD